MTMTPFTSEEEIVRVYSRIGVELRRDDMADENFNLVLEDIIDAATATIASYTLKWYNSADLVNSEWVRRRATIIAAYYLSMRRANGTQFNAEYQRIMEELALFLKPNPPMIPADDGFPVPVRTSSIPTATAYIVDDRVRHRKLRVNPNYNTKPHSGQNLYPQFPASDFPS